MRTLRTHTGRVATLLLPNVDTDQIIPKQFLKRIERTGFGRFLFYDWMKEEDFPLRRPESEGASILVAGPNFGCGSSREHAVWALDDYGFRVIIAPSFGDIFRTNATKAGLATLVVSDEDLERIKASLEQERTLSVDLESSRITLAGGEHVSFELDEFARQSLIHGLDDIARTLEREDAIRAFESRVPARFDTRSLPAA